MKAFLTILMIFVSTLAFCQEEQTQLNDSIQEAVIYHFDMRKHMNGQYYYIKTPNDTIRTKDLLGLKFSDNELPKTVYLTILREITPPFKSIYKTVELSYIKLK